MNKNELQKGRVRPRFVVDVMSAPVRRPVQPTVRRSIQPVAVAPKAAEEPKYYPLPAYQAPERPVTPLKKRRSRNMLVLRGASVGLAVFLATGGFIVWRGYANFHKAFRGTNTVAALSEKKVAPYQLKGEGDGRVNILLLGIGGPGHDGADLTDTMVVLSVDPVNNTASMLSVPRDLWVKMPVNYFGSSQKINAAYESGKYTHLGRMDSSSANANAIQAGFEATDQVIKDVFDTHINYHVLVNFQAFRQAIDTVGGVTVNVPAPLVDPTMAWENAGNPVLAAAGVQQMNGVKALQYARSRETTSDFARAERQRQLLMVLKDKILTAGTLSNPAKIDGLMNAFGDNVYSDLSSQGALRLMSIMKQVSDSRVTSLSLADDNHKLVTTDYVGDASVVRPIAGFGAYLDIQNYVHSQLPDGYLLREHAPVTVLGISQDGANSIATTLTNYGYTVSGTATTANTFNQPVVVDLSHGSAPYTRHYLEQRLGAKAVTQLPPGVNHPPATTKFVILVTK